MSSSAVAYIALYQRLSSFPILFLTCIRPIHFTRSTLSLVLSLAPIFYGTTFIYQYFSNHFHLQ